MLNFILELVAVVKFSQVTHSLHNSFALLEIDLEIFSNWFQISSATLKFFLLCKN